MRVAVVDTYYPAFLAAHYAQRPGLRDAPYDEQLRALMERAFGTSDAYSTGLRAAGHEAVDLVVNAEPLQLAWAREHGVAGIGALSAAGRAPGRLGAAARLALLHRIAAAQLAALRPDVVYLQDLWWLSPAELRRLHARGALVAGQIASAAPPPDRLRAFDVIFTSFPHYVERFRALGVDSEYLAIAFDERLLDRLRADGLSADPGAERPHDVVFVGGVNPAVHPAGTALLEWLCARLPLSLWGYGAAELAPDSPILARHRGEAWGLEMYRVLARAKIVVNRHIEAAEGHANNMRLFESTGAGALVLTEAAPNLGELFAPGEEVATYTSEEELVARVQELLGDDARRVEIARAGQERTLRDHTYAHRTAQLARMLEARVG